MLSEYKISNKYRIGTLRPYIYLCSDCDINYEIDNGIATVHSITNGYSYKLECMSVSLNSEETLNGRFKFNNQVSITLQETTLNSLFNLLNTLIKGKYNVVVEDIEGHQFIMNLDFPAFVTYNYTFNTNSVSPHICTVTFATDSNFPTLFIERNISNFINLYTIGCHYNIGEIKDFVLCNFNGAYIVRDGENFTNIFTTGDETFKQINFLPNSFSFTEEYNGEIYTHSLSFSIPLSDYKSYWQYNLIEFKQNRYVALFETTNHNIIATGFENGYFPSYTITTSESVSSLNTITITLQHISEQGIAFKSNVSLDDIIDKNEEIYFTNVDSFYVGTKQYETSSCLNNTQGIYTLIQEITSSGVKLNRYWALEGYEDTYRNTGLNIVGIYTQSSNLNGFNIIHTDSSCASFNTCDFIVLPNKIYNFNYNTKTFNINIQSTCNWSIINIPGWITLSQTNGEANTNYSITMTSTATSTQNSSFTIVSGNQSYVVNVNYAVLEQWRVEDGAYLCSGSSSYQLMYKWISTDGSVWTKTTETKTGSLISNNDNRCEQYEVINDTQRWVIESNNYICEWESSEPEPIEPEIPVGRNVMKYTATSNDAYVIVNGSKYNLPQSSSTYTLPDTITSLKFYVTVSYQGDPLYDHLSMIDLSSCDLNSITNMSEMFYSCSELTTLKLPTDIDTSSVTSMAKMFTGCKSLSSINVSNFNTRNVATMEAMFKDCSGLSSLDLSNFSTSNLKTIDSLFSGCTSLRSLNICGFGTSYYNHVNVFSGTSNLTVKASAGFISWAKSYLSIPSSVTFVDCNPVIDPEEPETPVTKSNILTYTNGGMYNGYVTVNGTKIELSGNRYQLSEPINSMSFARNGNENFLTMINMNNINTSKLSTMDSMFSGLGYMTSLIVNKIDTGYVTSMMNTFINCGALTTLDLTSWNTGSVTTMYAMFANCSSLTTLKLGVNFDTVNCKSYTGMFSGCAKLRNITCTQNFKEWAIQNKSTIGLNNNINWTII